MNVNSVTNSYSAQGNGTSGTSSTATATYENFLKLLMAQMKNQDPTEPMKSTEYMSQLATFSQVEQTVKDQHQARCPSDFGCAHPGGWCHRPYGFDRRRKVSGEVISVVITNEGAVAKLKGGEALLLGPGVVVS